MAYKTGWSDGIIAAMVGADLSESSVRKIRHEMFGDLIRPRQPSVEERLNEQARVINEIAKGLGLVIRVRGD